EGIRVRGSLYSAEPLERPPHPTCFAQERSQVHLFPQAVPQAGRGGTRGSLVSLPNAVGRGVAHRIPAAVLLLISAGACLAGEIPSDQRRSDAQFLSAETRAMQDDDTANPGMLWVLDGEGLWGKKEGSADRACADCHGDAGKSMKGVAARYPAFDA